MTDTSVTLSLIPPRFEPRQFENGGGWYVHVAWSEGDTDDVDGFASEQDAKEWIEHESARWERLRSVARIAVEVEAPPPLIKVLTRLAR